MVFEIDPSQTNGWPLGRGRVGTAGFPTAPLRTGLADLASGSSDDISERKVYLRLRSYRTVALHPFTHSRKQAPFEPDQPIRSMSNDNSPPVRTGASLLQPLAGCRRTSLTVVLASLFSISCPPSLHGLSPTLTLLLNHPTSLPTSSGCRCLHSELPCLQGSAEISWSKTLHFPVSLSSPPNEPLGILGVVSRSTQTRFILPYEASLSFRNPFCFRFPPHRTSRSCSSL